MNARDAIAREIIERVQPQNAVEIRQGLVQQAEVHHHGAAALQRGDIVRVEPYGMVVIGNCRIDVEAVRDVVMKTGSNGECVGTVRVLRENLLDLDVRLLVPQPFRIGFERFSLVLLGQHDVCGKEAGVKLYNLFEQWDGSVLHRPFTIVGKEAGAQIEIGHA